MIDAPPATAWYVYGIVPAPPAGRAAAGSDVGLVEHGGLAAAVGEVPLTESSLIPHTHRPPPRLPLFLSACSLRC